MLSPRSASGRAARRRRRRPPGQVEGDSLHGHARSEPVVGDVRIAASPTVVWVSDDGATGAERRDQPSSPIVISSCRKNNRRIPVARRPITSTRCAGSGPTSALIWTRARSGSSPGSAAHRPIRTNLLGELVRETDALIHLTALQHHEFPSVASRSPAQPAPSGSMTAGAQRPSGLRKIHLRVASVLDSEEVGKHSIASGTGHTGAEDISGSPSRSGAIVPVPRPDTPARPLHRPAHALGPARHCCGADAHGAPLLAEAALSESPAVQMAAPRSSRSLTRNCPAPDRNGNP